MCGIAGAVNFGNLAGVIDRQVLVEMTETLAQRGPDAQGMYVGDNVMLGHRRLSIIDLVTGDQPIGHKHGE